MGFFDFMTEDIAIDLGTANTLIIHNDKVVIDSPSIVARDRISGKIIAVGKEANMMQGKTHENIKTIRPLKDGVIADFDASEKMISMFIKSIPALNKKMFTPALRMVVCIPSGITEVEMRAVKESCERVNGKEVYLIHEPMAAAIGIGIDIMQPKGNMIVDIGGGTTEIAVIALGGIVCDKSVKIAGDVFTNDIVYYMRTQHNLFVGESTAEKIKIQIGAAIEDLETPPDDISFNTFFSTLLSLVNRYNAKGFGCLFISFIVHLFPLSTIGLVGQLASESLLPSGFTLIIVPLGTLPA